MSVLDTDPAEPTGTDRSLGLPAWARELDLSLPLHPQILLTGNVRDQFPVPRRSTAAGAGIRVVDLAAVIQRICRQRGYQALAALDPIDGRLQVDLIGDGPAPGPLRDPPAGEIDATRLRELLTAVVRHSGPPIALLIPYAARVAPADADLDPAERRLLAAVEALGHTAAPTAGTTGQRMTPYNTIFWVCERQEELHAAFPLGSHALRVIRVPRPDLDLRHHAAGYVLAGAAGRDQVPEPLDVAGTIASAAASLADVTHGLTVREVLSVGRLSADRQLPVEEYDEAARLMRVGVTDDKWSAAALQTKIATAAEYLNRRVLGQPRAVARTIEILVRSAVGLNGAQQASSPNRPRGVLFLAGPTGVGKTELAKGVASLVLGEGAQPLRFDMSEFRDEHAGQRLIGSPPGYVGHDAGGELTNMVRAQPVCVLLFDEIEKAHARILDLFLQILEDGRLTDGTGATVHFTECFLIFTSNLGVTTKDKDGNTKTVVTDTMPARSVQEALQRAFDDFFNKEIGRPELRNRFGDSYVVLDFIEPEIVPAILEKMLTSVVGRVARVHKARLVIGDEVRVTLVAAAVERLRESSGGGRGISTVVESALVNPLARELFERPATSGETLTATGLTKVDGFWTVQVARDTTTVPELVVDGAGTGVAS